MPSIGAKSDSAKEAEKEKSAIRDDKAPDYGATSESGSGSEEEGGGKGKKGKAKVKTRPISDLFRYATGWDRFLVVAGSLVSIVTGAGWPFMSTIFGGLSNTFIGAQNQYTNTGGFANGSRAFGAGMNGSSLVTTTALPEDFDLTMEAFQDKVIGFCLQYVYLACAVLVAGYLQMACWITACERQIFKIRSEFFHAILRQNIGWYDEHQSGEMTTKLSDNLERVKEGIGDKFGLLIQYCAQFLAGFIIAFFYSWKLTLVMMSLTPLLALSGAFMSRMIASSSRKEQEKYAVAGAIAEEVFSCIRTVIAFNGQKQECRRYEKALESGKRDGILKSMYTGLGLGVTFMILFCAYALAFWYGSVLILSGEIERGTVFVVFFSVMMGSFALGNAAPQISVIATAKGSGTSLLDIIDRVPHIDPYSKEGLKLSDARGRIDFKNVRFNYPSRKKVNVLTGMNFSVEPGETVALVGASGCGKSTIVSLLLRYYDADSGTISIDGSPVEELNVRWLRNLIGVVSQEPVLFDATLEENIKMGRENISYQEMVKAAKMANAHNFIMKLPDGYNTMVGERGTQLSGGQKQRIAIARALVRDPKILLLDEATSALDAESEGIVQEALDKAAEGRTTIIIAHRLSTVRNADKILAIELGEVKESGTHAELMKSQGLYHSLVTAQIFEEPASGYATGTDGATDAVKEEDGDSGTDADSSQRRRRLTKQKSHHSTSVRSGSLVSSVSMDFEAAKARRMSRLLSRVENEKERMRRELEEEGVKEGTLLQIMAWNKPEWLSITIGMLGAIVRGCVMPAFAFFYGEIFNAYSKEGDELKASAEFWSIMFIVIGVVQAISLLVSTYFFGVSGESLTMRLRLEAFKNLLRQDVAYFDHPRHSTGKLTTRLASDAPNIKAAVDFRLATVLSSAVSMVAGIVIAVIYGWQMALLTLALVPVIGLGGFLNVRIRTGNAAKDQKLLEDAGKVASEAIENPRTVQSLTRERSFHERFIRYLIPPHKHALKQAHVQAVSFAFAQSIFFFFYAACFRFGAYLIQENLIEPLGVYRVFFAIQFSGMTIGWATAYFPEFIKAKFASALIFGMIKTKPSIDSYSEAGMRPELSGALELEDVHFAYPTRPKAQVLKGLSVKLEQNKTLALVGQSGCGKSTVVSLLERFYDPLDGSVSVDTHDLRAVNIQHLRSNIALVSQEPVLFDCSIQDNITYGLSGKSKTEVVEAAKKANIHDFISGLPQGYETRVGEKGTQLSGGQKQRVAIARALVRDPKILLLDEATSALDTESEKIVQEALDRAREGRTSIIIAHRLSTVQSADTIAVVSNGVVVEQGSHGELQAKKGAYYALTKKQNLNT